MDRVSTDVATEGGGMSRRLAHMTEESIETGGRGAQKAIEDGGFSEELRKKLEARIQDSTFKSENPAAFAQLNMPVSHTIFLTVGMLKDTSVECRKRHPINSRS